MRLKKQGEWIQYHTEKGKTFYYHETTGNFQWEDPAFHVPSFLRRRTTTDDATGGVAATAADVDDRHHRNDDEQQPWKGYTDPASGALFWYNHVTGQSQWDCPLLEEGDGGAAATTNTAAEQQHPLQEEDLGEHFQVVYDHENDLGL